MTSLFCENAYKGEGVKYLAYLSVPTLGMTPKVAGGKYQTYWITLFLIKEDALTRSFFYLSRDCLLNAKLVFKKIEQMSSGVLCINFRYLEFHVLFVIMNVYNGNAEINRKHSG